MFLNRLNVTRYKTNKIVCKSATSENIASLLSYFEKYHHIYQYVYSLLFTKYLMQNQKRGINIRAHFVNG